MLDTLYAIVVETILSGIGIIVERNLEGDTITGYTVQVLNSS